MLKNIKEIPLLIILCFTACLSIAQQIKNEKVGEKYRAVNWGLDEGLSKGDVYAMIKDINGFLWIKTSFGLNRFDGSSFKKYFADKTKKNKTIIGNHIQSIKEDSLHNIWIGTDKGLSVYDIKADSFRNTASDLPGNTIIPFWATNDEVFCWDFPGHQFAAYNIHSFAKRTLASFAQDDTVGYGESGQYAIFEAGSNSIWMEKGYRGTGGGLLQISLADGKRKSFDWACKIPNHSHWSEGMRYDRKRNSIWIGSPDGLMEFTLNDKKFHHIDAMNEFENIKGFWQWAGIDIDLYGRVWMGTVPAGIIIYDPSNNSVKRPFPDDSVQQKKVSDANVFLYCDKDGMVWTGSFGSNGIYQIIPFSPAVKHYVEVPGQPHGLPCNFVTNCIHAGQGILWMGSPIGINIFNPHSNSFDLLRVKDLQGIKEERENLLIPLNVDTVDKMAWIFFNQSLFEMDIASRKCRPILYEDSNSNKLPLNSVLADHPQNKYAIPYKSGLIIAASLPDHHEILLVNGDNPVARKILSLPDGTIDMSDIASVSTNDDNLIFIRKQDVRTNLTYAYQNNNWVLAPTPLDSVKWSRILYNKADQTYWVVIEETQLTQYDKNFQVIHNYTNDDGMPGVQIHGLIPDNNGNIWFTTDRLICKLNTKTGTIIMLDEKDGIVSQNFGELNSTKDDDGDVYIPGDVGLYRISPGKYTSGNSAVYFESLKINQQAFPLSAGINDAEELSLKYFENNIDLETGILDYYSKGKGHIRYKLEADGKTAGWQYAPAYYNIRFEQLPPGKYKLTLQSANASNELNRSEKILLFKIAPPFWKTWWFIVLAAILVGLAVNALFQFRFRQKIKVLNVRQKLHRDLHDDVGATLSSVKAYSEILETGSNNPLITELIKNNAEEMIDKLEVISWATNPHHDSFKSFKDLIFKSSYSLCYARNIDLIIQSDGINEKMVMPGDVRQNLFLIFKEAINNIIKYSEASRCDVQLFIREQKLFFIIKDNGNGFSGIIKGTGNGWKNMQKRAEDLYGKIKIENGEDNGTIITISLPYPFKIPSLWGKNKRNL